MLSNVPSIVQLLQVILKLTICFKYYDVYFVINGHIVSKCRLLELGQVSDEYHRISGMGQELPSRTKRAMVGLGAVLWKLTIYDVTHHQRRSNYHCFNG